MHRFMKKSLALSTPVLFCLACCVLFVCCTPQWLPDSSGFVYVATQGAMWYDVKTKKSKRLADARFPNAAMAVWPGGKRVVISRVGGKKRQYEVQISVYDLAGVRQQQSPRFELSGSSSEGAMGPQTYVSQDEKKVLTFLPQLKTAVLYDIAQRKFRKIDNVVPFSHFLLKRPALFDVTPLTPDGKGFLAATDGKDGPGRLKVFQWDGETSHELRIAKDAKQHLEKALPENEFGVLTDFVWQMGVLTSRVHEGVLTIDPKNRQVSYLEDRSTKQLLRHAKTHDVHVMSELSGGAVLQVNRDMEFQVWRQGRTTKVAQIEDREMVLVLPSPDRKWLLLRVMGNKDQFHVINAVSGQVHHSYKEPTK